MPITTSSYGRVRPVSAARWESEWQRRTGVLSGGVTGAAYGQPMTTVIGRTTRGPNKNGAWSRATDTDGEVSVIRLALDTSDPLMRRRVEVLFDCCFQVRRAVQHDARARVDAFWAAHRERARVGPKVVRERVCLTRTALEKSAYGHLDAALHLKRGCTKALSMHLADNVWTAVERHLFADASGRRHGRPRAGRWHDFTRIPGRARSHTKARKWETFRLHGTLDAHRAAYAHNGKFHQPRRLRAIRHDGSWWDYDGPLAVVLTGLGVGEVVLPVRLPAAPSNQAPLDHHLADPERWHKVDLVRTSDPTTPGGWRYEAHLMVLIAPYASPATETARAAVPTRRRAGADLNVANLTVASHDGTGGDVRVTRIDRDHAAREREARHRKKQRARQKALDRSRRNQNPDQYLPSQAQQADADRRAAAGLPPKTRTPAGPRKTRADAKPVSAYRRDRLSDSYRSTRTALAADEASRRRRSRNHARDVAKDLVAAHGPRITVEDVDVRPWARQWGRGIAAFTPGRLQAALAAETEACGGAVAKASTGTTALSQHCLCGHRTKKQLRQRTHRCAACGLVGDRDAVAALLAAHVHLTDPAEPSTATLDVVATRRSLHDPATWDVLELSVQHQGRQDAPSASTHTRPDGPTAAGSDGPPAQAGSARRTAGQATDATPQQPRPGGTSADSPERNPCMPPDSDANAPPLRSIS